ncbi:MAG: molybdopterin-dependent oxidoreductase [Patescibacteria group bacterium]|nr:molybdopterin-dependent oxidoreductase [Patescibacteria group bacterium]
MTSKTITNTIIIVYFVALTVGVGYFIKSEYNKALGRRFLDVVEVRQYEGQNLSSVNDFRENSIKGPQFVDRQSYRLKISGLAQNPQQFSYDDVISKHESFKKIVTLNCVEGWSVTILWEGIKLKDIINEARPSPDAKVVIFHAADGYTTSFPIEYFVDNDILLAYKMNDAVLPPERGFPFQLVAESKWGYKWIKWVTEIEFSDNQNYQGYWEKRGYSDTGDLNEPFLK